MDQATQTNVNVVLKNLATHLGTFSKSTTAVTNKLAVQYADSNDPAVRQSYLDWKKRSAFFTKLAGTILEDPMLTPDAKAEVYKQFPQLLNPTPAPPVVPAVAVVLPVQAPATDNQVAEAITTKPKVADSANAEVSLGGTPTQE